MLIFYSLTDVLYQQLYAKRNENYQELLNIVCYRHNQRYKLIAKINPTLFGKNTNKLYNNAIDVFQFWSVLLYPAHCPFSWD